MSQPIRKTIQENCSDLIKEQSTLTLLIDGNSLLFTSMRDETMNNKGEHVGGVHQFMLQIRMQLTQRQFDRIVVFFDDKYSGLERWKLFPFYKQNRDKDYASYGLSDYMKEFNAKVERMQNYIYNKNKKGKPVKEKNTYQEFIDENFDRERDILCEMFNELCIRWHMDEIVEGDDLIAHYCLNKKKNERIVIVSSDMDITQLLSEDIIIYNQQIKKYISTKNFKSIYGYDYRNTLIKKIFLGDTSDCISNIKGLSEKTFSNIIPEYRDREITIEEVKERARQLNEERIKEKKKPLQVYENIVNGVSNREYDGDFYVINEKIINLKKPLMTKEAIDEMEGIMSSPLDMEDRNMQNLCRIINENQIIPWLGDTTFASFFSPFRRIYNKEKEFSEKE